MDDRVSAFQCLFDRHRIAQVAFDFPEFRVATVRRKQILTVDVEVENGDAMALRQKLGDQPAADVAGPAGHHHVPRLQVVSHYSKFPTGFFDAPSM